MIVVKLQGGLGNQMFQYAFAKSIKKISGQKVYFDLSFKQISKDTPRQYALGSYKAADSILKADLNDLPLVFRHPPGDLLKKVFGILIRKEWFNNGWKYITDNKIDFSNIQELNQKNIYFDGYWPFEEFFRHIRTTLLSDFSLKNSSSQFESMLQQIKSFNSASIHVRHGDYLSNSRTNAFHGICSPEYYQRAISLIQTRVPDPKFFIFTDDVDWAYNYFTKTGIAFELISGKGFSDQEELILMSACHHQIIANSSFSWWGAWLNKNQERIVIAPAKWYANTNNLPSLQISLPENWIRL